MSEASYLVELREAAPSAPDRLREIVQTLPVAEPRRTVRFRPALVSAAALVVAVGLGAAVIGGMTDTGSRQVTSESAGLRAFQPQLPARAKQPAYKDAQDRFPSAGVAGQYAPSLTAKSRLQRQDVAMSLRVKDLSGATQSAVRTTRRLGGFVAGADYSTDTNAGNSRLTLRVPVPNLQKAIASFTGLGTILSQHISVADLQTGLDRLDVRIAKARRNGKNRAVTRLERRRDALMREGTYARVALDLTTTKPAAKHVAPSRFDRFRDNTKDILGKELIGVLYALVIAGPFILLGAALVLGERARRRRADHRLLEETG
jgi:hypothetical protein